MTINIIAQNGAVVNIAPAKMPEETIGSAARISEKGKEKADNIGKKWAEKKAKANKMAQKMKKAGYAGRAERMEQCAEIVNGGICRDCGSFHILKTYLCRDRFCPICSWRLALKRFANMFKIVCGLRTAYPEAAWQFVTLTTQNCQPSELKETLDEMCRVWNNIASTKKFKAKVAGWARSLEITYNKKTNTLHPHFHILTFWQEGTMPDNYVIERWLKGMNRRTEAAAQDAKVIGWLVDENEDDDALTESVLETYKYSVKDTELAEMPLATFKAAVDGLAGRRMVALGGKVKEYAAKCRLDNMESTTDEEEEETIDTTCYSCHGKNVVEVVGAWTGSLYLWRQR